MLILIKYSEMIITWSIIIQYLKFLIVLIKVFFFKFKNFLKEKFTRIIKYKKELNINQILLKIIIILFKYKLFNFKIVTNL